MFRLHALTLIGLLAVPGCLSGSYDEAHGKSLSRYREAGDFQKLHREPKSLADGRLVVRVPKLFTKEVAEQPPLLGDLAGFCVTLQELLDAGGNGEKMPAALSIWAPLDDASGLDDVKKRITDAVKAHKDPAFGVAAWSTVDMPQGGPSSWAVMTVEGQQPFDRFAAGDKGLRETKSTDGTTKIWVAADPAGRVCAVLMWRVPKELAASCPLDDLAPLVARTVSMKPAAPQAAPAPAAAADEAAK